MILQGDELTGGWQMHIRPPQLLADSLGKMTRSARFAMHDKGFPRLLVESAQPFEQGRLVGMGRQASDRVDTRPDRYRLAEDMDQPRPVDQPATHRSPCLEACNQHAAFAARQVLAQVVLEPPRLAHATGRKNDRAAANLVQGLGTDP